MTKTSVRISRFFDDQFKAVFDAFGLLVLRLSFGGSFFLAHGWGKLVKFEQLASTFPDPLGVGSAVSLGLVVFAEVFCSFMIVIGFATRLVAVAPFIMMFVAFFIQHGQDPFSGKEKALLYGAAFLFLILRGSGSISLDRLIFGKR